MAFFYFFVPLCLWRFVPLMNLIAQTCSALENVNLPAATINRKIHNHIYLIMPGMDNRILARRQNIIYIFYLMVKMGVF